MSEEIVKDAERVVWWWESMYIASTGLFDAHDLRVKFMGAINSFRRSKIGGDPKQIAEAALLVLSTYDGCVGGGYIADTDKALNAFQYQKNTAEQRLETIEELKEEKQKEREEYQKRYDELLEQYGVMKGRYEEVSERLDRLLKGQRPER